MPLLGDEIVYGICAKENHQTVPVFLAEVRQGKTGELRLSSTSWDPGIPPGRGAACRL